MCVASFLYPLPAACPLMTRMMQFSPLLASWGWMGAGSVMHMYVGRLPPGKDGALT